MSPRLIPSAGRAPLRQAQGRLFDQGTASGAPTGQASSIGLGCCLLIVVATILMLALFAAGGSATSAQETRTISGRVVNGTAGSGLPPGLPVMLQAFDRADRPALNTQTAADDLGRFQFDGLALNQDWSYALSVNYSGVRYSTLLNPDRPLDLVELKVYETTQEVSAVAVKQQVLVIADVGEKAQQIAAVEFVQLTNQSDRTLLPDLSSASRGQFSFLRFSLPAQAAELDVRSDLPGGEVIPIGTGFAITSPVPPGDHDINFSFRFPYQGNAIIYRQSFLQGAGVYQVLLPSRLSQIQITPLQSMPAANIGNSIYQVWERRDIKPGEGLTLELTHLPQPGLWVRLGRSVTDGTFWQISIPSIVGATVAFLLLYSVFRSRRGQIPPLPPLQKGGEGGFAGSSVLSGVAEISRIGLIREVAVLDESFQRGEVPEAEYRTRREQLKAGILEEGSHIGLPMQGPVNKGQGD